MKGLAAGALILASLALAGCKSTDESTINASKPLDKMSNEEWCAFYSSYLSKATVAPDVRKADLQAMRARGCPNT
jgi:hypothetical protein